MTIPRHLGVVLPSVALERIFIGSLMPAQTAASAAVLQSAALSWNSRRGMATSAIWKATATGARLRRRRRAHENAGRRCLQLTVAARAEPRPPTIRRRARKRRGATVRTVRIVRPSVPMPSRDALSPNASSNSPTRSPLGICCIAAKSGWRAPHAILYRQGAAGIRLPASTILLAGRVLRQPSGAARHWTNSVSACSTPIAQLDNPTKSR